MSDTCSSHAHENVREISVGSTTKSAAILRVATGSAKALQKTGSPSHTFGHKHWGSLGPKACWSFWWSALQLNALSIQSKSQSTECPPPHCGRQEVLLGVERSPPLVFMSAGTLLTPLTPRETRLNETPQGEGRPTQTHSHTHIPMSPDSSQTDREHGPETSPRTH